MELAQDYMLTLLKDVSFLNANLCVVLFLAQYYLREE
jgi:hypothetical protein